jgi:hypothetical protein
MNLREAAQQALEALEDSHQNINPERRYADELTRQIADAITSLRAALAEDAMQRLTDVQQEMEGDKLSLPFNHIADANKMVATSQEFRQVEPVAYVTGFSKGYATVRPVDPCLLMCVGMALYRSPPTISKTETVEPVAWIGCLEGGIEYGTYHKAALKLPDGVRFDLYTAPPKRKPISTDMILATWVEECIPKRSTPELVVAFARAIERAIWEKNGG